MAYLRPKSSASRFIFFLTFAVLSTVIFNNAVTASEGGGSQDHFQVYEACDMIYGYSPEGHVPSDIPGQVTYVHNRELEECHQAYYREKFCRNQFRELNNEQYQRICKKFNQHYLKFFALIFGMIGGGAVLRTIIKLNKLNIPYTVTLMLIGMGLGALSKIVAFCPDWVTFTMAARTPPEIILNVFLPILIFESSFNMKAHLFFRSLVSILILALPGMVITTFLTAFLCQLFFFSYEWSFLVAALFGSIISATDPVAVVSILKEVGTSETLGILVDGESLLNDGVAILFYEIFSELVEGQENTALEGESGGGGNHGLEILRKFSQITLGGPVFGWVMGKLTIRYLSLIFNDAAVEVSVTLCAAYLTYFIAENYIHVSGVMALVLLGITLSSEKTCISPEVQGFVSHFWEMLGYLANTVLFVLVGIVITETAVSSFKPEDGYYLIFLYFALNIARFIMIAVVSPLLSRIGYGLSWQNMVVMTWGGLRGAVGICLALQTFKNKAICHRENIGPKILLQTAGIVILTLLINGTTTKKLLDMLKLTELSIGKIQDMANAVRQIRNVQYRALSVLRHDRFLSDANWTIVEESTNIVNPYVEMHVKAKDTEEDFGRSPSLLADVEGAGDQLFCPKCDTHVDTEPSGEEFKEMTEEARLRLLKALKVSCWHQYEIGILTEESVQILVDMIEHAEDKKFQMIHAKDFQKYWEVEGIYFSLRKKLLPYTTGSLHNEEGDLPLPQQPWRHVFHRIAHNIFFSILIYSIIIGNMVPVIWECYYMATDHPFTQSEYIIFYLVNVGFTLLYLGEFAIKVLGIGFGEYMNSRWNIADVIILIISLVEVILSGSYIREELSSAVDSGNNRSKSSQEADFLRFIRFIRIVRIFRIIRFFKPLLPMLMKYLNNRVNKKIFLGYDIGKGFVAAVDDVQKFLPQMIDNPKILLKFRQSLETQRVEVVREMGLLQKEHPGIAIAVKTRHASRAVLNQMRESLLELKEDGLVDEQEFEALNEEIEQKMKHLWNSPAYMKPASAELVLANVTWMAVSAGGGKDLFQFIYKQATLLQFVKGDTICQAGTPANGIYIVVSGLVKIKYEPTFESITEREDYGVIPNMEIFHDLTFENDMQDYFSTGTVIGELGVLTDRPRAASVTCETSVLAYHIPQSVMKQAIELFEDPYDSLEARMWRTYGMNISASLLPSESAFASWTMDKVKTYLELSAVPLGKKYEKLDIPEFVSDVVIVYGQACNFNDTEEVFTAPCLIPRTCRHIKMKPNTNTPCHFLIIAHQDIENVEDSDDSDFYEEEDNLHENASPSQIHHHVGGSELSLQKFILAGTKRITLTEEEALTLNIQRQSRTVNFGVVKPNKSSASKSAASLMTTKSAAARFRMSGGVSGMGNARSRRLH